MTGKTVLKQISLAFLSNFSNIAPGMAIGFSAVAIPALRQLTTAQISWFASIASLATPLGCLCSGPIADRFGRRNAIRAVNVCALIGWLIIGAAFYSPAQQYGLLLAGRFVTGVAAGLCGSPASVYMAEVASVELRSVFTTWVSLFYAIGIFIVYLLGLIFKDDWGSIALIAAVFPLIGLLFLQLFIPESPPWLVTKQRFEEARTSMCRLHGTRTYTEDVQLEMETLLNNRRVKKEKTQQKTLPQQFVKKLKMLTRPNFLRPYRLVLAYFFFQQFTGIFAIMYYAIDIVKGAQVALDPHVAIVAIALVRLAGMVLISFLSTRLGRRTLGLASGVGIALSMLALGSYIVLLKRGLMAQPLPLVPLALLVFYFFITTIGFYPLPFALASEVYPKNIRGTAAGISTASTFVFNFVVVKLYPTMVAALGDFGVFYFYGGMGVVGTLFVLVCMPETKGRTLEEIQAYFVPPGAEPPEAK
ncbi:hypothetical protein D910_08128, partial [Dendroctonus ponderosae]